eukprot:9222683-Alexandrium_andersonii.AAC.1
MSKLDCLTKALAVNPPDLADLNEPVAQTFKNLVDRAKVAQDTTIRAAVCGFTRLGPGSQ